MSANLTVVTWDEVKAAVSRVNPALAAQINALNPSRHYPLLKVSYPFGADILKAGTLKLPNANGDIVSKDDSSIDIKIKEAVSYTPTMPMGIILNKNLEMYWEREKDNSFTVWHVMQPGRIFGMWGLLQDCRTSAQFARVLTLSAGCRSLMTLPKISDAVNFKRLKKEFGLHSEMPLGISDQWHVLKELIKSPQFDSPWQLELLFFTTPWYQQIYQGLWKDLHYFLLQTAWKYTAYHRDEEVFEFIYSRALTDRNLKPNPYLTDTVKHIYSIARGCLPGFKVATDDNPGPINRLEQIFSDIYQLKFAPTFMHLSYFNPSDAMTPHYYSLEVPILFNFSPKSRKVCNKMNDIREVKQIQTVIKKFIEDNKETLEHTPIYDIATKINYSYYHSDHDRQNELKNTSTLSDMDAGMQQNLAKYNKALCTSSPFLRGCVRIGAVEKK